MDRRIIIFASAVALFLGVSGVARAADAVPAPDTTMIDLTGSIVTTNLAGGVADPVPLFVGSSGPVVFVLQVPDDSDPSLKRPGLKLSHMAGTRPH